MIRYLGGDEYREQGPKKDRELGRMRAAASAKMVVLAFRGGYHVRLETQERFHQEQGLPWTKRRSCAVRRTRNWMRSFSRIR